MHLPLDRLQEPLAHIVREYFREGMPDSRRSLEFCAPAVIEVDHRKSL